MVAPVTAKMIGTSRRLIDEIDGPDIATADNGERIACDRRAIRKRRNT